MALEPLNREIIVLRYFDGVPPREIGPRLGLSGGAVRARLHRSLERLRQHLDADHGGDRKAWTAAVPTLLGQPVAEISASLGAAVLKTPVAPIMKTKTSVIALPIVAFFAVGSVLWWTLDRPSPAAPPEGEVSAAANLSDTQDAAPVSQAAPILQREPIASPAPASLPMVEGRVEEVGGQPVGGLELRFQLRAESGGYQAPEPVGVTDPTGSFSMPFPATRGRLVAQGEDYVTLLDEILDADPPQRELLVIVAPRREYGGIVLDDLGARVADAPVQAVMEPSLLRGLRPGVRRTTTPQWEAKSDESGAFSLGDVGWTRGLELRVQLPGYMPYAEELPALSRPTLVVTLHRIVGDVNAVQGRVVNRNGTPVPDTTLFLGEQMLLSDDKGRFVFERGRTGTQILAAKRGYLPARYDLAANAAEPITVVLEGEPLRISGLVVDRDGSPIPGAHVWTRDGEPVVRPNRDGARFLEEIIGPGGDAEASGRHQQTDEEGRFTLSGLLPRSYTLFALRSETMEVTNLDAVLAGRDDVRFLLDGDHGTNRVAGRVLTRSGVPIPGVRLLVGRHDTVGDHDYFAPLAIHTAPITDAQGHFEFPALCVRGTYLIPSGEHVASVGRIYLDDTVDLGNLVIRMPSQCHLQVLLETEPESADSIMLLDAEGEFLRLSVEVDGWITTGAVADLADGKSEVVTCDDRASWLILRKAGQEVRRVPIRLRPGAPVVIRL
jgi:hypothetical protein